jgi:hypothetical protein
MKGPIDKFPRTIKNESDASDTIDYTVRVDMNKAKVCKKMRDQAMRNTGQITSGGRRLRENKRVQENSEKPGRGIKSQE